MSENSLKLHNDSVHERNDNPVPFLTPKRKLHPKNDKSKTESEKSDTFFSPPSSPSVKIDEMLEKYKTYCSRHKRVEMAQFLGVNPNTLNKMISRANVIVTNTGKDPTLCHFCENTVSKINIS